MVEPDICNLGLSLNITVHCYETTTCSDRSTKGPTIFGEQNLVSIWVMAQHLIAVYRLLV